MIQTVISDGHRKWNELHSRLFDEVLRDIRRVLWQKWQFSAIGFNGSFDLSHFKYFFNHIFTYNGEPFLVFTLLKWHCNIHMNI